MVEMAAGEHSPRLCAAPRRTEGVALLVVNVRPHLVLHFARGGLAGAHAVDAKVNIVKVLVFAAVKVGGDVAEANKEPLPGKRGVPKQKRDMRVWV